MEIARAAAGLFAANGLRATRAEDIARAVGVAPRTFYRYFATKEESLAPLFSAGAQKWAEGVRDAPAGLTVPEALRHAVLRTLTPGVGVSPGSLKWVRTLLRLADTSPALMRVWAETCKAGERELAEVLATRTAPATLSSTAATLAEAAVPAAPAPSPKAAVPSTAAAPPEPAHPPVSPSLRFAAAVAGAAVRVAVESWAAGDEPPDGPHGPVGLALRNLEALRGFPWDTA